MNNRKLISELPNYQKLLDAIKSGDTHRLVNALHFSVEDLDCIDSNGKTLLEIIKTSTIDINKAREEIYDFGKLTLNPLQALFHLDNLPLRELQIVLKLGANVNQIINEEGNTFLHWYVETNPHPYVLRYCALAGGDFLKKNKIEKSPIDLASKPIAVYIKKLIIEQERKEDSQTIATKRKVLRHWRLRLMESKTFSPVELKHVLLDRKPKEPSSHPPDKKQMQRWIDKHCDEHKATAKKVVQSIQHISFKHLLFGLKMATKKFNQYLFSLPENRRDYVILVDRRENKSGWWMTKLAEKYLAIAPKKIISTEELQTFAPDENWHHLVWFDDASFSGNFFCHFLKEYRDALLVKNPNLAPLQLHFVLPFVSNIAKDRLQSFDVTLHYQETIPSFSVKGTVFKAVTAAYFDHNKPDKDHSTIECLHNGKLVNGEASDIRFVDEIKPPYK